MDVNKRISDAMVLKPDEGLPEMAAFVEGIRRAGSASRKRRRRSP